MSEFAKKLIAENKISKDTFLDLGKCGLTELPPELLELTHLESLNLGKYHYDEKYIKTKNQGESNLFTGKALATLAELPALKNLFLSSDYQKPLISDADISFLSPLVNLTSLYLSSNQITDISFLSSLANLTSLDLKSNQISDISFLSHLVNLKRLDLRDNKISDISFLSPLVNLTSLYLWKNQITDISFLSSLANLTSLDLMSNQITDISFLSSLVNLIELNIISNQISDISFLSPLVNLTELGLSQNQISDTSFLSSLTNLTSLDLMSNQISDISFLSPLVNLTRLDLRDNKISDISFLKHFDKLVFLRFSDNPHLLYIPVDLETKASDFNNFYGKKDTTFAQALIRYVLYAQQHSRAIKEAKVIFVGDPAVGKTSLIRRFLHGTFDAASKSTEKIEIHHDDRQFFLDSSADSSPLKVHFWDFGGQEIQHSLHKLFMSERCVYVCVIQARTEDKAGESPVEYWLELIRQYGGDSPVIVVVNKCDVPQNKNFKFSDNKYKEQYPSIHLPSIQTDSQTGTGMEELKNALQAALNSLIHVRFRLPEAHFAVKESLQKLNKDYISIEKFDEMCEEAGKKYGFDFQENDRRYLADLLHDLGVVVYFKEKDHDLSSKTVLDPAWISEGMYKMITSSITKEKNGILQKSDIKAILEGKNEIDCGKVYHKQHEQGYILNTLKNFQLAYESTNGNKTTYFIPRQFHQEEPPTLKEFWKTKAENSMVFRYQYSKEIPTEIMSRLIVKLNEQIHENMMFREGFVIKDEHTWAYVRANTFVHYINISLTKNPETKYLLYWIRKEIQAIHDSFAELKVKEVIVYQENNLTDEFDYQELKDLLAMGETHKPSTKLKKRIPIDTLLGAVEIPTQALILKLIDEWWISEAFKEIETVLERQGGERHTFSQIRSEFIQGTKDFNFAHRLKVFVETNVRN